MNAWIEMYTDGACKSNPGPGGWGVLIHAAKKKQELCGGEINTTNNRMELTAVIKGVESLPQNSQVRIITDSQYVKDGMTKWIKKWRNNGWVTSNKQPVKNRDLWEQLDTVLQRLHKIEWVWVKGHAGTPGNERADQLANQGVPKKELASSNTQSKTTTITNSATPSISKTKTKSKPANKINSPNRPETTGKVTKKDKIIAKDKLNTLIDLLEDSDAQNNVPTQSVETITTAEITQATVATNVKKTTSKNTKRSYSNKKSSTKKLRQIVLDTETTGLTPDEHRIIEIGAIELIDRRFTNNNFHQYLQPDREIEPGATKVHGIVNAFLEDKPRFADIAADLIAYLQGAELIIHNAPFDTGFLDAEFARLANKQHIATVKVNKICTVTDTLIMARQAYPGKSNNLDALCKRYNIDQSHRTVHGALLDAKLLATVYLAMTGGQATLSLAADLNDNIQIDKPNKIPQANAKRLPLQIIRATLEELELHQTRLEQINQKSNGQCLWLKKI
ncbi:hypothetical protein TI05_02565 [Achromatium sp. WMS3]|nr:hypothetical protein TI05_02565 [Achromatium sp. WMS3]